MRMGHKGTLSAGARSIALCNSAMAGSPGSHAHFYKATTLERGLSGSREGSKVGVPVPHIPYYYGTNLSGEGSIHCHLSFQANSTRNLSSVPRRTLPCP